jgi:hypothetical protein
MKLMNVDTIKGENQIQDDQHNIVEEYYAVFQCDSFQVHYY